MSKQINWEEAEEKAGGNFKSFYADGVYKAKCVDVEIKNVGDKGSTIMKFALEDGDDGRYPTIDHWLSWNNDSWRYIHNKRLMQVLGATEDAAKKAVEMAESKDGKENKIKAYEQMYKKLLAKKPEVEIEVYTENNYARAEFTDRRVSMPHGNEPAKEEKKDDVLSGAEEVDLSESDIPF